MRARRVIITGATGFIGRNLAEDFNFDGIQVLATGRSLEVGRELLGRGIEFEPADLTDAARVTAAFSPADCVVHCAGKAGDWGRAAEFFDVNVKGTRNVVRACRHHRIGKIIFISTPNVYFNGRNRLNISESDRLPKRPRTVYAKTKLLAEKELLSAVDDDLRTIILRPRAVYGPHDNIILPRILQMSEKRHFPLIAGGQALTDITYIDNLMYAVRRCLDAPAGAWNQVYNISNDQPIRIRDWFGRMLEIFDRPFRPKNVPERLALAAAAVMELASFLPLGPKKPMMTRFSVGYMAKNMTMSIEKARRVLGYLPRVDNEGGFQRLASWHRERAS
jgi:nucleoside-diphosphate-sugar epimerase